MDRVAEVLRLHDLGYNCAQAVACAYCDLVGADKKSVFCATEALGLGMGGMNGTCGAVSGACVIAGLKNSSGNLLKPDSKKETYKLSKTITDKFLEKNGCLCCRELKGADTGVVIRKCSGCMEDAAKILEEVLSDE